jgi:hypothetical protein
MAPKTKMGQVVTASDSKQKFNAEKPTPQFLLSRNPATAKPLDSKTDRIW